MNHAPLLHVVLYQPEIPQNTGNVGRTCLAVGARLWLVRPLGFRLDAYHLRRAGLDYWQQLAYEVVDDWPSLVLRLPTERYWYFSRFAARTYDQAPFEPGDALVFGGESQGLPPALWTAAPERALRIPMRSAVRSLNLSSAVAVAVYEALRQIGDHGGLA